MAIKLQPLADRVVVKPIEKEEVTKSGIVIPDTVKEKPQEGKIIAVGPGKIVKGENVPLSVKVGDKILFSKPYGASKMKVDNKELLIIKEDDILAIIE